MKTVEIKQTCVKGVMSWVQGTSGLQQVCLCVQMLAILLEN